MFCAPLIETLPPAPELWKFLCATRLDSSFNMFKVHQEFLVHSWRILLFRFLAMLQGMYECRFFSVCLMRMWYHDTNSSERSTVKSVQVTTTWPSYDFIVISLHRRFCKPTTWTYPSMQSLSSPDVASEHNYRGSQHTSANTVSGGSSLSSSLSYVDNWGKFRDMGTFPVLLTTIPMLQCNEIALRLTPRFDL